MNLKEIKSMAASSTSINRETAFNTHNHNNAHSRQGVVSSVSLPSHNQNQASSCQIGNIEQ